MSHSELSVLKMQSPPAYSWKIENAPNLFDSANQIPMAYLHCSSVCDGDAWTLYYSYRRRGRRSRCRGKPRTVSGQWPAPSSAAGTRGSARATPAPPPRRRRAAARHRCRSSWSSGQQTKVRSWTRTSVG